MQQPEWDVVIAGAGPAGATAAIHLARAGCQVLLLDKARFPRDKVCGDALIADAWRSLERLGLLEAVQRLGYLVSAVAIFSPSRTRVDVPGPFLTMKRRAFDVLLVDEAVRSGAVLRQGTVVETARDPSGAARVRTAEGQVFCGRVVLLATGADVSLASRAGLVTRPSASAIALRCYVKSTLRVDHLVISFDRAIIPGYAWIFPLGGGEYNVGCGVLAEHASHRRINLRRALATFLGTFPLAHDLMRHAVAVTALKGGMLRCGLTGTCLAPVGNVLAIGETAGSTLPFTGEGIGKAMETGAIAAETIDTALRSGSLDGLNEYRRRIAEELKPRYLGYELAQRWLSIAWINDVVAARTAKSRHLTAAFAGILHETVDPRAVCSIRGLLTSFLR